MVKNDFYYLEQTPTLLNNWMEIIDVVLQYK